MNTKFDVDDVVYIKAKVIGVSSVMKNAYTYTIRIAHNDSLVDYLHEDELREEKELKEVVEDESE